MFCCQCCSCISARVVCWTLFFGLSWAFFFYRDCLDDCTWRKAVQVQTDKRKWGFCIYSFWKRVKEAHAHQDALGYHAPAGNIIWQNKRDEEDAAAGATRANGSCFSLSMLRSSCRSFSYKKEAQAAARPGEKKKRKTEGQERRGGNGGGGVGALISSPFRLCCF